MDRETEDNTFLTAFRGRFTSALRWHQLDDLWAALRADADGGWYVYALGEAPPAVPASGEQLGRFIDEVDRLLRAEHHEDYCGIVYADHLAQPGFVKIYDPGNLGAVCGFSEHPPLPGWVLSKIPPLDVDLAMAPSGRRRRWWQRLFS